ncbi:hypothetical protein [Pseudanabaena sp. FACHB-2040]|uniref:hypothetical protein n=1 Tax=Pseudanabaena sp. FACHB-2040 TaxID=2692859 RepID=UPI0016867612|nr:hypothetical protein [Pseudanabaena sp. FACHB-2040]
MDELRSALELATEEELQALTDMLFRPKFNPLDYLYAPDPLTVQSRTRQEQLDLLEERFRFLAADGLTVISRRHEQISYRQVLVQVCKHLNLPYSEALSAEELEAEIFLHLLEQAWNKLSARDRKQLQQEICESLATSPQFHSLPLPLQTNPMGIFLKGSTALAVSSVVKPWLLQQIARQFALHMARYEVAKQTLGRGGAALATQIQSRVAMRMASRGMAVNAARYGTTRSLLAWVGPMLWMWFFADLGWRAIATNHGRIIPVVFTLAQIRLTRSLEPIAPAYC